MIIIAIIAIVVSVFTAGAAIGFIAGGWTGAMAGGVAAFSGGLAAAAGAGAAAGGFLVGTAASAAAVAAASTVTAGMVASAIGGFVSGLVTGSLRMIETGGKWFKQVVIPAGISAIAAAATFGIGHGLDSVIQVPNATGTGVIKGWDAVGQIPGSTLSVGNTIIKPILHGLAQGGISELQGGEFKDGFISASVGSLTGSLTREFNVGVGLDGRSFTGTMLDIALAGASGGAVNTVTGGDFWEGFATASSVALFNDAMRLTQEEKSYPYLGKMVKGYGDSVYWDVQKPDEAGHWLRDGLRNVFSWFSNEPASNSVLGSFPLGTLEYGRDSNSSADEYIRLGDNWGPDLAGKVVGVAYLSDFIQSHPVWNQGDGSSTGYQQAIAQSLSADLNRPVGPFWTYPAGVVDEFLTGIPKTFANGLGIETRGSLMEAAFKNGDILTPYYQTANFQSGQADSWIWQTAAGGVYSLSKSGVFSLLDDALSRGSVLNGHGFYVMDDSVKAMTTVKDLRVYYQENNGRIPSFGTMDRFGAVGGEIDTITGDIKLNMSVPLQYRAGFRAEEYLHFKQLHERGWLGRELSGDEIDLLEDEAFDILSNAGFKPVQ